MHFNLVAHSVIDDTDLDEVVEEVASVTDTMLPIAILSLHRHVGTIKFLVNAKFTRLLYVRADRVQAKCYIRALLTFTGSLYHEV